VQKDKLEKMVSSSQESAKKEVKESKVVPSFLSSSPSFFSALTTWRMNERTNGEQKVMRMYDKKMSRCDSAEHKVRQCREKGTQTNMLKLNELEIEREGTLRDLQQFLPITNMQLKLSNLSLKIKHLETLTVYLSAFHEFFSRGWKHVQSYPSLVNDLRQEITRVLSRSLS